MKFSKKALVDEIKKEGRILNLHPGMVEIIAEKVADKIASWLEKHAVITEDDLNQQIAKELKKYHEDLAYVYENRGKII